LLSAVNGLKTDLLAVQSKGGLVVVEQNDCQITVYALDSYSRKKAGGDRVLH